MIILLTCTSLIALTASYNSILTDLFALPILLFVLSLTHLKDEATGVHVSGIATILDLISQSFLTVGIVIIEYLLFAGFCIPF
jgi:hypothetical protein